MILGNLRNSKIENAGKDASEDSWVWSIPESLEYLTNTFQKPWTGDEWSTFHENNKGGIATVYSETERYHIQDNKLFIVGTGDLGDFRDWVKTISRNGNKIKAYLTAEKALIEQPRSII